MSEEQEIELGRKAHQEVLAAYPVYDDPRVQAFVERLGEELATASHRHSLVYHFTVLDMPMVNAFALPGGYIYITRGILGYMNSEAELAGVLGHELGHVTARHSVRQQSKSMVASILATVAAAGTGYQAAGDISSLLGSAVISGYGREYELEADRLGAEYLARVGYDPDDMIEVIGILKDQEEFEVQRARAEDREPRTYHGVFATHPRNDRRLQEVVESARQYQSAATRTVDNDEFLRLLDGMTFGESEDQGAVRGNRFYHAGLDLFIEFPAGWRTENEPHRLVAVAPDNDAVIQFTLQDMNRRQPPEQFLRGEFKSIEDGRELEVHGESAYAGVTRLNTPWGSRDARIAAIYHDKNILLVAGARKSGLIEEGLYLDTIGSVRALRPDERELARARRLRIVEVSPGDTFSKLAAASPLSSYAEEQLRLLNGMYPTGEPAAGALIKIVE